MNSSFDNLVKSCSSMKMITGVMYNSYELDFRLYQPGICELSLKDKEKEQIAISLRNNIINMLNEVFYNRFDKNYSKDIFGCEYAEAKKIAQKLIPLIPIIKGDYSFSKEASLLFDDSINQICINFLDRGITELNRLLTNYFNYSKDKEMSKDLMTSNLFVFYYKDEGYNNIIDACDSKLVKSKKIKVKSM